VRHRLKDEKADTSKHQLSQTTSICHRALSRLGTSFGLTSAGDFRPLGIARPTADADWPPAGLTRGWLTCRREAGWRAAWCGEAASHQSVHL